MVSQNIIIAVETRDGRPFHSPRIFLNKSFWVSYRLSLMNNFFFIMRIFSILNR